MSNRYKAIAAYYDLENERHPMLQADVPFLLEHIGRRLKRVLEVACGTARASIPIAQAGHRVVGFDYDPEMIAIAQRKRDVVGLSDRELNLAVADALSYKSKEKFDYVVLLFNTFLAFTTLEEQDKVLMMMRRHLAPGGRVWIDIFQPNLALLSKDVSLGLEHDVFYVPELSRTVYRTTDIRRNSASQVQTVTFNYRWFDDQAKLHREKKVFDMVSIFPREFRLLLERNKLSIEHLYGNYDGSPLGNDSPRMIACCKASQ